MDAGDASGEGGACMTFPAGLALSVAKTGASGMFAATLDNASCDDAYLRHACCGPVTSWHLDHKQSDGSWKELPYSGPPCGCAGADSWKVDAAGGKSGVLPFNPISLGAPGSGTYRLVAVVGKGCDMGAGCTGMTALASGEFAAP